VWGRCRGSGAEPYETMADHAGVAWRCTCPSRKHPCKHVLALLLMWVRGHVQPGAAPAGVVSWIAARDQRAAAPQTAVERGGGGGEEPVAGFDRPEPDPGAAPTPDASPSGPDRDALDRARDERIARMLEGLAELDRWLEDRMRTGLADPALARYATWDTLAARLVDARAGALANRVRRLAGLVGAAPDWQAEVLAELGLLHLIAQAGSRLPELPGSLADAVATASGWQVRQADVLAGVPETDDWMVLGRSDTREDRIEVRRVWVRGVASGRWAMLLSFAAYQQSLDDSWLVGTVVRADLHRYPGEALRALAGARHAEALPFERVAGLSIADTCVAVGERVAAEPWIERLAVTVHAAPTFADGRWLLSDDTGSLPLAAGAVALGALLAAADGGPVSLTVEWTPAGLVPLTVHLPDRALDIGPRADPSFVGAA
jgi:SWIM zinc finger